jgi:osmotically-inducible protein OsmY
MMLSLNSIALYSLLAGTPKNAEHQPDAHRNEAATLQRDAGMGLTPMDQLENETDLKLTQRVRQAVIDDDRLSFTAKNVKIISRGGAVTLRGEVNTNAEREIVRAAAAQVAGVAKVDDQLQVAAAKSSQNSYSMP